MPSVHLIVALFLVELVSFLPILGVCWIFTKEGWPDDTDDAVLAFFISLISVIFPLILPIVLFFLC